MKVSSTSLAMVAAFNRTVLTAMVFAEWIPQAWWALSLSRFLCLAAIGFAAILVFQLYTLLYDRAIQRLQTSTVKVGALSWLIIGFFMLVFAFSMSYEFHHSLLSVASLLGLLGTVNMPAFFLPLAMFGAAVSSTILLANGRRLFSQKQSFWQLLAIFWTFSGLTAAFASMMGFLPPAMQLSMPVNLGLLFSSLGAFMYLSRVRLRFYWQMMQKERQASKHFSLYPYLLFSALVLQYVANFIGLIGHTLTEGAPAAHGAGLIKKDWPMLPGSSLMHAFITLNLVSSAEVMQDYTAVVGSDAHLRQSYDKRSFPGKNNAYQYRMSVVFCIAIASSLLLGVGYGLLIAYAGMKGLQTYTAFVEPGAKQALFYSVGSNLRKHHYREQLMVASLAWLVLAVLTCDPHVVFLIAFGESATLKWIWSQQHHFMRDLKRYSLPILLACVSSYVCVHELAELVVGLNGMFMLGLVLLGVYTDYAVYAGVLYGDEHGSHVSISKAKTAPRKSRSWLSWMFACLSGQAWLLDESLQKPTVQVEKTKKSSQIASSMDYPLCAWVSAVFGETQPDLPATSHGCHH